MYGGIGYATISAVVACLMAFLGSALGLRCVVRCVHYRLGWKPSWLALGAGSLGCAVWMMHFIALSGSGVPGATVTFDTTRVLFSLVLAVLVAGLGLFAVGCWGDRPAVLGVAGPLIGLGVAAVHYAALTAMHVDGSFHYRTWGVVLSLLVAVGAATVALWSAVAVRGVLSSLTASLVMAVAIVGTHYTALTAAGIHVQQGAAVQAGRSGLALLPLLFGPALFLLLATGVVVFDPLLILGRVDWDGEPPRASAATAGDHISEVHLTCADGHLDHPGGHHACTGGHLTFPDGRS
ncbi:MHYT domain-containing protein [Streptomyces griseofuscus]|uniref:MHYT domain-containing protein n=1 Tax=Streptomyces griseofuscus TaxID=146922 RepID=UPI0036C6504C